MVDLSSSHVSIPIGIERIEDRTGVRQGHGPSSGFKRRHGAKKGTVTCSKTSHTQKRLRADDVPSMG